MLISFKPIKSTWKNTNLSLKFPNSGYECRCKITVSNKKHFTIFHFLSKVEIPKMFQFPTSQIFANLEYVFIKAGFHKTFQRITITVLDLFWRNTRFPVLTSYLIFVGESHHNYLRRNQYHRKFLRWRDLPQYLTSFCCKALHLRCLWGYYYASVHRLLRQLFYTKKHYFIVNFSVNLYRNFGSKNWVPPNYGKHLKNILQPINSFKVIKYLKVT